MSRPLFVMGDQTLRVLLIEDDRDHAELVQGLLEPLADHPVVWAWADTLAKGIAHLQGSGAFDAVLCDLSLPDSSLSETVLRLRPHAEGTPIVVLTSLNDMDVALRAVREGAQDYLVKTQLSSELLLRTIRHAVERSRHMAELARMNETLEQRVAERTRDLERALAKPEVRFTDKYLEASYTYWNTLLTVEGLLLTFFSVDVVGDPDAGLYAYGLVGCCMLAIGFLIVNVRKVKGVYFRLGLQAELPDLPPLELEKWVAAEYLRNTKQSTWLMRREFVVELILVAEAALISAALLRA